MLLNLHGILSSVSLAAALFVRGADATDWSLRRRETRFSKVAAAAAFHGEHSALLDQQDIQSRISSMCFADTQAILDNTEYATAVNTWSNENAEGEYDCVTTAAGENECTFDSTSLASHDNLVSACLEAGGQSYLYSYSITCNTVFADGSKAVINFKDMNEPECIAPSCTTDDLNEYVDGVAELRADDYEFILWTQPEVASATCSESDPIGNTATNPTTPSPSVSTSPPLDPDQQCNADMQLLYSNQALAIASDELKAEF